jgi:hypothetical protein
MSVTRLFSRTIPFLFVAVAPLFVCGSATPAMAAPRAFPAAERRPLDPDRSSSIDPCLVGRWLSINVVGLNGAASGLAKMQLTILGNGQATLDLTGSTPYVEHSLDVSDTFIGTEAFKVISVHTTTGYSFSIFPSSQHIRETIDFVGQKHTKVLSEGFFDAADYTCGPTKLRTNFDLSEGGVWVHDFIATFQRH